MVTVPDGRQGLDQPRRIGVAGGAQHGFGCDERGSFSKPDYELAQQRTLDFFAKNLG